LAAGLALWLVFHHRPSSWLLGWLGHLVLPGIVVATGLRGYELDLSPHPLGLGNLGRFLVAQGLSVGILPIASLPWIGLARVRLSDDSYFPVLKLLAILLGVAALWEGISGVHPVFAYAYSLAWFPFFELLFLRSSFMTELRFLVLVSFSIAWIATIAVLI